jgi:hypothetical protein
MMNILASFIAAVHITLSLPCGEQKSHNPTRELLGNLQMPTTMPTPTPTPISTLLPRVFLDLPFVNTLGPTLAILLQFVALLGAVYGFFRGSWDLIGWLRRPRLNLCMSDDLWPVAEQSQSQFAINIQFVAYNPGKRMVALRRLEASLFGLIFPCEE